MQLNLGETCKKFIDEKIQSGLFNTADEVIEDALQRQMEEESEREKIEVIHELIAVAEKEIENGEGIPYTPELMYKIGKEVKENANSGKPISDVIKP